MKNSLQQNSVKEVWSGMTKTADKREPGQLAEWTEDAETESGFSACVRRRASEWLISDRTVFTTCCSALTAHLYVFLAENSMLDYIATSQWRCLSPEHPSWHLPKNTSITRDPSSIDSTGLYSALEGGCDIWGIPVIVSCIRTR